MNTLELKKEWKRRQSRVADIGRRRGLRTAGPGFAALFISFTAVAALCGDQALEMVAGTKALYRGEYAQARELVSKYVASHPEAVPGRILLARAEIAQGQYEAAYQDLRRALDLDPTDLDALYYLERLCTILSQIEFRQLIQAAPDSFRAHQLMAESYLAQHREAEAEKEYETALRADPSSVEILDALGEIKRRAFKFDDALPYYERAAKLAPRDYTSAYGIGACYLFKQNPRRATEGFRRALTIDANSAAAHLALGDALLREGRASAAVSELRAAAKLVPDMRQAYTLLARAYQKLGQAREAQEALEKERDLAREELQAPPASQAITPAEPQPAADRPGEH